MNTTSALNLYSSEHCWSRRSSFESILSIQGKETDYARDTSDTDPPSDVDVEYEPCSELDAEDPAPNFEDSSEDDNEVIIQTKVIEAVVKDDGDLEFADSEQTETDSDSEVDFRDYSRCVQCGRANKAPLYRFCVRCFKVRKNLFPPRPKRKHRRKESESLRTFSQDSGICSQESVPSTSAAVSVDTTTTSRSVAGDPRLGKRRRSHSADENTKRTRFSSECDSDVDSPDVQPLVKTASDPSVSIEEVKITKKIVSKSLKEKIVDENEEEVIDKDNNLCIICCEEPKSGVFVHGRVAHICCCYKCATKVWNSSKRCPICNSKVSNVLRACIV